MTNPSPLAHSLRIQFRVIGALLMREVMTRYGRHNIGFLWLFAEPMLFTLGVTYLWTLIGAHRYSDIPIAVFALTGYSSVLLWRNMPNRCCGAVEPNLALMYHRNVKILDIFASRILLEMVGASASFIALGSVFTSVGWIKPPEDILKVIFAWFMIAWFGAALALLIGALSERSEIFEKLWHPITYFLFPLSGVAYLTEWLPEIGQKYALWLPVVNGIEMLREGYFGSSFHARHDMFYMFDANLVLSLLGLSQVRVVSRTVTPQ